MTIVLTAQLLLNVFFGILTVCIFIIGYKDFQDARTAQGAHIAFIIGLVMSMLLLLTALGY